MNANQAASGELTVRQALHLARNEFLWCENPPAFGSKHYQLADGQELFVRNLRDASGASLSGLFVAIRTFTRSGRIIKVYDL